MQLSQTLQAFTQLHAYGFLIYTPQKDKPQLYFLQNRIKTEVLHIDENKQSDRKKIFTDRVENMIRYVQDPSSCRSMLIGNYFGDTQIQPCGKCDNCLARKRKPLAREEFEKIHQHILTHIRPGPLQPGELLQRLGNIEKENAWQVIQFLEAENKIVVDRDGAIRIK